MASSTCDEVPLQPLYRRVDSVERGRHLVANCSIPKGRLIFTERPLVALQSLDNQQEVKVCHCCKAFLGGPDYALVKRFQQPALNKDDGDTSAEPLSFPEDPSQEEDYTVVPCRHNCGHAYCSKECEADAWRSFHQDLCTGLCESIEDPIVVFKQYATQTNEILLMVAEWWVAQHRCTDDESFRARYTDFTMPCWWDVAAANTLDQIGGFAEGIHIQESLRQVCIEAADLLNQALTSEQIPRISHMDVSRWIGACEQNSMGIRQRHPLCRSVLEDADVRQRRHQEIVRCLAEAGFIGNDNDDDDHGDGDSGASDDANDDIREQLQQEQKQQSDDICGGGTEEFKDQTGETNETEAISDLNYSVEEIEAYLAGLFIDEDNSVRDAAVAEERFRDTVGDDLDYIFPPLDGTAMYYTACKMNHSCDPNVIVLYKGRRWGRKHPLTAYCIAYKDIQEGEELTISYIETNDPLEERQKALANYGFLCKCSKCENQRKGLLADSDKTKSDNDAEELFGVDSEDDGDDEQMVASETADKKLSLQELSERLDSAVNHSKFGNLPIELQGKVTSFILPNGTDSIYSIKNKEIIHLWGYCHTGLTERDFCLCKIGGTDLEDTLYRMLREAASWPSVAYRKLYWCASLSSALGLAHEGSFIEGQRYLDKARILGLPRMNEQLFDFFAYVEKHASESARGPYTLRQQNDFMKNEIQDQLETIGLSAPISKPVFEGIHEMGFEEFSLRFVSTNTPVVIRGFARAWRSTQLWHTMSTFSGEHGYRLVPVEIGSMMQGKIKESIVTLRSFVDEYLMRNDSKLWSLQDALVNVERVACMAQHPLLDQIPALANDIELRPHLCGPSGPTHVYFWLGTGGTRTPLLFDSYENLFVQTVGAKYVRLYDPNQASALYVHKSGCGLQGNMSEVNCEIEDFEAHPLAKATTFQEVLLYPGDALYIPARTWHYVRSLTTSVSVNYWF